MKFTLRSTDEYDRLVEFMIPFGLEFDVDDEVETDIIKCWKVTQGYSAPKDDAAANEDYLAAGCILAMREGEYIIDGIAVDTPLRKTGIGKIMMDKAVEEVKNRGGERIYLVAKAPDFFKKLGFVTIPPETAPNFFECGQCPQFKKTCFPEVMKLEF